MSTTATAPTLPPPPLSAPTFGLIQLSCPAVRQQLLLSDGESAELHLRGVMDARDIQRLRPGDFVTVNPSSCSEFWIAQVRACFLQMDTLEVVWWTRFRRDGKSLIRRDHRVYRLDDGHHSSFISVAAVFGILEDYKLCSEESAFTTATSYMNNSKGDHNLKEDHKKEGEDEKSSDSALLIIGEGELERFGGIAEEHGKHCAKACRRRVRTISKRDHPQQQQLTCESSDESSSDRNINNDNNTNNIVERDASARTRPRVSSSQAVFTNTCQMPKPMEPHLREILWCAEKLLTSHQPRSLEDQIGLLMAIIEEAVTTVDVLLSRAG